MGIRGLEKKIEIKVVNIVLILECILVKRKYHLDMLRFPK